MVPNTFLHFCCHGPIVIYNNNLTCPSKSHSSTAPHDTLPANNSPHYQVTRCRSLPFPRYSPLLCLTRLCPTLPCNVVFSFVFPSPAIPSFVTACPYVPTHKISSLHFLSNQQPAKSAHATHHLARLRELMPRPTIQCHSRPREVMLQLTFHILPCDGMPGHITCLIHLALLLS